VPSLGECAGNFTGFAIAAGSRRVAALLNNRSTAAMDISSRFHTFWTVWLLVLVLSPFTAPFSTCAIADLFARDGDRVNAMSRTSMNHGRLFSSISRDTSMATKKRCSFMIDRDVLQQLREIQLRTGLSTAEQIREGIRWWLKARQWPDSPRAADQRGARSVEPDLA
jgi:hypothetical protein